MGLIGAKIAKIISFARAVRNGAQVSDATVNPGGNSNLRTEHFADSGDDSYPLPIDYSIVVGVVQTGAAAGVSVGYADVKNEKKAQPGEKRIYARDANGDVVVELWLQNDGTAILSNDNGSVTLGPNGSVLAQNIAGGFMHLKDDGDLDLNGVLIDTDGNLTSPETITGDEVKTAAGIDLDEHTHGGVETGSGNTGPAE